MAKDVLEEIYSSEEVVPPLMKWKYITVKEYEAIYRSSIADVALFWGEEAKKLVWTKPWSKVVDGQPPNARWFVGGEINAYYNIVEKHRDSWIWGKPAIIWENELGDVEVATYEDLHNLVSRLAGALKSFGVKAGDWIAIYASPTIESLAVMLAAIKIGAPFEAIFTGFGFYEVAKRIASRKPKVFVVSDGFYRRGKVVDTLSVARKALDYSNHRCTTIVIEKTGSTRLRENEISFDNVKNLGKDSEGFTAPSNHPLFGLHVAYEDDFKPITHGVGGYLVQTFSTSKWIGLRPHDTYFCTVWPGWITGITYVVFGPLMIGSTIVLYDGSFDYPSADRWWDIIERYAVTLFLTTGSALRILSRAGDQHVKIHNMDTLKAVLVTAEPLETSVWWWTYRVVGTGSSPAITSIPEKLTGRIPVINMYIQSELATFVTGNLINHTFTPITPGSVGKPIPGFSIDVVDDYGKSVRDSIGELVLRSPWPSTPIEAPQDFWSKWVEGFYRTGDYALMTRNHTVFVLGRKDCVLKVSGYRLSPGAVENVVREVLKKNVLVVGAPDKTRFEVPIVIASESMDKEIVKKIVREYLGPIMEPADVRIEIFDEKSPRGYARRRFKEMLWNIAVQAKG